MIECPDCASDQLPGTLYCTECGAFLLDEREQADGTIHPFTNVPASVTEPILLGQDVDQVVQAEKIILVIPSSGRRLKLSLEEQILIGRADPAAENYPEVDLTDDYGAELGVSRRHAAIRSTEEGVIIEDLGSTNGTMLNHYRLPTNLPYPLHSGDELRFGDLLIHVFLE
jgi:pSer/pThr/pTyr-binding forkhead associated (FHA) protein